jgi:solute carrier family 25 phosphate transporter 23/24/25/41
MVTTKHASPQYASGLIPAFEKIIRREGILAFWRGNLTSLLHRFPYSGINFFVFEKLKGRATGGDDTKASPSLRLACGAVAGSTACLACYPLDLIRTRMTAQVTYAVRLTKPYF